jgi:hypothetical protein
MGLNCDSAASVAILKLFGGPSAAGNGVQFLFLNFDKALENCTIRSWQIADFAAKLGCSSSLVKWFQYVSKMWDASFG